MPLEGSFALELEVGAFVDDLKKAMRAAAQKALVAVANALLQDTLAYVPVLTGDLLRTGRVETVFSPLGDTDTVRVIYGDGEDVVYAEYQHEEELNHPSLGFRGRAEYVRRPFELNARFYMELFRFEFIRAAGL